MEGIKGLERNGRGKRGEERDKTNWGRKEMRNEELMERKCRRERVRKWFVKEGLRRYMYMDEKLNQPECKLA